MTIFALSTASARAGLAVIRLSGPSVRNALSEVCGIAEARPRHADLTDFRDPASGDAIDRGLALFFPGPASFTGEDVAELHCHGSRAVVARLLDVLGGIDGLRSAEPGEFTRRAFENGKLDLTQVEGLADLIDAETEAQRAQARRQLQGVLGQLYEDWRGRMIRSLAHLELMIDFPDEEVPNETRQTMAGDLELLRAEIADHLADNHRGERLRDGVQVVILGPPNAGKSSLLNAIARRDVAIVSEIAGTTRDTIEVHLDLGGYPVTLIDTAGLRETADQIEFEGVRRALARAETADIRIYLIDGADPAPPPAIEEPAILLVSKSDLGGAFPEATPVSIIKGQGIPQLLEHLARLVVNQFSIREVPAITRLRHRRALEDCVMALDRFLARDLADALPELAAEDIRIATRALGRITGRVDVEDLLDVIFRDFCIGK